MTVSASLLDFVDIPTLPKKRNDYKAVTKQVRYLDSILATLGKGTENIKEDLENPSFGISTSHLKEEITNVKEEVIEGCISKIKKELPSIFINNNLLTKAGMLMKDFDARTFINYMKKQYSDVDYITLSQWQYAIIEEMVPARLDGGEYLDWKQRTAEHIKDIDSAGIELYLRGRHFSNNELLDIIVKFSKFVAGDYTKISEIEGFPLELSEMETGKVYTASDLKI